MATSRIRSTDRRGAAFVDDIAYVGPDGLDVEAYLVRPSESSSAVTAAAAGIVMWHWLDSEAPDGNRTQYLDEAADLAAAGAVCLLPQGRFPWSQPPTGSTADATEIRAEVARLRAGLDLLGTRPEVDPARLGVVGHDFGGMIAAVESADEDRLKALALVAATPRWADWFLLFWDIDEDRVDYLRAIRPLDPIECIGRAAPAEVLLQFGRSDFFIAAMSGLEFKTRSPQGTVLLPYDSGHDMRLPEIVADRRAFLVRTLGLDDA